MDTLTTSRLHLRRFTRADADDLHALDNDAEVMRYINGGIETPRRVVEEEILPAFLAPDPAHEDLGFWAAAHEDRFAGWVSLRSTDTVGDAVLGYRFRRETWGRGLATEAVTALLDHGLSS